MDNWKFKDLKYTRPDLEAEQAFLAAQTEKVKNAGSADRVYEILMENDRHGNELYTTQTLAYIRNTLDTADPFYEAEIEFLNNAAPLLAPYSIAFDDAVAASPFRPELEKKLGKQYFVQKDLQKRSFCEKNIPLMQREAALTTEYQKMMASCAIEFDGKTLNLYGIQKYFEHEDREVRRAAVKAYSDFYASNETRLEEIWDELITIRNEMGRNLGFESFIPVGYMQQGRTDYGMEEVASFREQVRKELVPLCEKLYEAQRKRLGVDELMFWDEEKVFPDGNAHPAGDDDYMIAQAKKMYHDISPETGEFFDFMVEHDLMDLKNQPHKAATGYMTDLPSLKAPFVFSVFNGTIGDMQVLSHEL